MNPMPKFPSDQECRIGRRNQQIWCVIVYKEWDGIKFPGLKGLDMKSK